MKYGLNDLEFQFLTENVIQPLKKFHAKVYIFGSRANGKFKKFSDIDILYVPDIANPMPSNVISQITLSLEDSDFAYKVDLVSSTELASSYRASVDREKIEV